MQAAIRQFSPSSTVPTAVPPLYHRVCRGGGSPERKVFNEDYVIRLTQGDAETEAHFTQYFGALLLIKLRGRVRSPQLAEDARQETFLRVLQVLRNKGGIQHPERLGAFVNSVCENVLLEMFRAGSRFQQAPENAIEPADGAPGAEAQEYHPPRDGYTHEIRSADSAQSLLRRTGQRRDLQGDEYRPQLP
jgi:DNA-directed RNA polymerase specialized sigma24 family protein